MRLVVDCLGGRNLYVTLCRMLGQRRVQRGHALNQETLNTRFVTTEIAKIQAASLHV
jgi:hypothetical protein